MSVQFDFTGKVAFVTGAGTGIGRATAQAFAQAGASVAVVGLTADKTQETARLIEQAGGRAVSIQADVANEADIETAVSKALEAFGRLDFAVNNAGVEQPQILFDEISTQEWQRLIGINLGGVFFSMKHQIPVMLEHGGGGLLQAGGVANSVLQTVMEYYSDD